MKKKIILTVAIVIALVSLLAVGVSAAKLSVNDYNAKYTLANQVNIVYYQAGAYNVAYEYTHEVNGETITETKYLTGTKILSMVQNNNVPVTFIDEQGNVLTSVPMWEYDASAGRYYSLVWYISDADFTYTETDVAPVEVDCKDLGTKISAPMLDLQGNPLKTQTFTSATYTLKSVRAADLTLTTDSWGFSFSNTYGDWSWDSDVKYTRLKGIYLDAAKTEKLHDNSNELGRDKNPKGYIAGYTNANTGATYETSLEAQMFAGNGNRIVVANLRDRTDIQGDRYSGYGSATTWNNAINLQCLWYPDSVKLLDGGVPSSVYELDLGNGIEIISCQLLRNNKNLKDLVIPNSCVYLANESFRDSSPATIVFGENMRWSGTYGGGSGIHTAYISKNFITLFEGTFSNFLGNKNVTIYFDGDQEDVVALQTKLETELSGRTFYHYDYNNTTERESSTGIAIFYNYNRCDAFYEGRHNVEVAEGNTCCGICEKCGNLEMLDVPKHQSSWIFNGGETVNFAVEFKAEYVCKWCKIVENSDDIGAIFVSNGISYIEDTKELAKYGPGVYEQIKIDTTSLEKYAQYSKQEFDYGIFACTATEDEGTPITKGEDGKGTADEKTVFASFTGTEYTYLRIKITGLENGASLYTGAYLVMGDNVSYFSNGKADKVVAKFTAVIPTPDQE